MTQFENHHLGVFFYLNQTTTPATFRLGVSLLGGSDVLGSSGTGNTWTQMRSYVTEINVVNRYQLDGINAESTGLAVDLLLSSDTDVLAGTGFRVGTWIKITLENYVPSVSSAPMWYVKVKSYSKRLDADGFFRYEIHAEDVLQDVLSTPVADYLSTDYGVTEGAALIYTAGYVMTTNRITIPDFESTATLLQTEILPDFTNWSHYNTISVIDGTLSDIVQPIVQGDAAVLYSKGTDPVIYAISHDELLTPGRRTSVLTFADNETDSHIAIESVDISEDSTLIINDATYSLTWDALSVVTWTDADAVDLYGRNKQELDFDYFDATYLTAYQTRVANASRPGIIKSITCDAVHHKNRQLSDVWKLYPTSLVSVQINNADLTINEDYFVTGITHTITPEVWTSSVELWRI